MLCKNWGFYFNGSEADWGSSDVCSFLELIRLHERYQNRDMASNAHVHVLVLALALARIIILDHCLNIAEREGTTFTCRQWMLLQVGFDTMGMEDLFDNLFDEIAGIIHSHSVSIDTMSLLVRKQFSSLRQRLSAPALNAPAQRVRYKILLVIDEAQNLSKKEFGGFPSQKAPSDVEGQSGTASPGDFMRPVLSPFVHGLYGIANGKNSFCVVPCGTGLSIFDMKWLEDSAPVPKGYHAELGPFTDFQGWESCAQVREYRDLVRRSLTSAETRCTFDARVPDESVPELFARLRGRARPIVSAIALVPAGAEACDILDAKAEIAGYVDHVTLGCSFETISFAEFLDAHVYHGSLKDGKPVPPFFHPAENPSGPDVVFVLRLGNHGYYPVFVQLKMRHDMKKNEVLHAFSTVKAGAVQAHLEETMLEKFCTGRPKRFFGVVIAFPAELDGTEGTFPKLRRSPRIAEAQGDALQCISLKIDKSNIHKLFPENHMQALEILKGVKRQLDQSESAEGSEDQQVEPATKYPRYEDASEDTSMDND
ncbi:hypothetical protein DFQ26_009077 [Actinomortierella ambigua]|nr:hypothetical protein DFQ26_009077 [Actinomortierella ambigua]